MCIFACYLGIYVCGLYLTEFFFTFCQQYILVDATGEHQSIFVHLLRGILP